MHASSPAGVCQHGSARRAPQAAAAGARLSLTINARAGRQHNVEPWDTGSQQPGAEGAARRSLQQLAPASKGKQAPTRSVSDVRTYIVRGLRLAPRLFSVLLLPRRRRGNRLRPAAERGGLRRNAATPPPSLTQLSTTFARRLRSGNSQSVGIGPKTSCKKTLIFRAFTTQLKSVTKADNISS